MIDHAIQQVFRKQLAAARKVDSLRKADDDQEQAFIDAILAAIEAEWQNLPLTIQPALESAMLSGIGQGALQIEFSSAGMIASANMVAHEYAIDRGAEMVGMTTDIEGNLIPNPDAQWAISNTTRERIREIVADSFTENTPIGEIEDAIKEALEDEATGNGIFSMERAELIAQTEVSNAQAGGNFWAWQKSGIVRKVKWLVSNLEPCDVCLANEGQEVELGNLFFSGVTRPPEHPNCACVLIVSETGE